MNANLLNDDTKKYHNKYVATTFHTSGTGPWSKSQRAVRIKQLEVNYFAHHDPGCEELRVYFDTGSWDTKLDGLIYCDALFLKELKAYLEKNKLPSNVDYSEQGMQGDDFVSLDVDKNFIMAFKS